MIVYIHLSIDRQMNHFNIKDIENLTGIKAHTLRIWEKRYSIIMPPTPAGKHRQYDNNDLRHMLKIASLYHGGIKIAAIAEMTIDEINSISLTIDKKTSFNVFIGQLIDFSIDMNELSFKKLYAELLETMGEENLYTLIIFPFLMRIGNLWVTGHILPMHEHFASNLIRNELIGSIDRTPRLDEKNKLKVILFCPSGEYHELPLLYLQYILKKNKVRSFFLGVNTSDDVVQECLQSLSATTLLLYMITNFTSFNASEYIQGLADRFPDKNILCGGPAFKGLTTVAPNVNLSTDFKTLIEACKNLV